jgi:hypothetical protein
MRQERGALTTPAGRVDSAGEAVCYLSTVIYWRLGGGKQWDGIGWDGMGWDLGSFLPCSSDWSGELYPLSQSLAISAPLLYSFIRFSTGCRAIPRAARCAEG